MNIMNDCGNVALTVPRRLDISKETCFYHGLQIEVWNADGHIALGQLEPLLIVYDRMFLEWDADGFFNARITIDQRSLQKGFKMNDQVFTSVMIQRDGSGIDTFDLAATPEPSTLFLLGSSLLGGWIYKRIRKYRK